MNESLPILTEPQSDTGTAPPFLLGFWYYAMASHELVAGKTCAVVIMGEPILLGRTRDGAAFALSDTCPHRGTLLSRGSFDGQEVECPYHGWRFNSGGQCTAIPSQLPDQRPQPADIKTNCFPVQESQGNLWLYMGRPHLGRPQENLPTLPGVPEVPAVGDRFQLHLRRRFDCGIDLAITGLMDPAHGAFVHASTVWRGHRDVRTKEKQFSPAPLGWRMDKHTASGNARAYRLFLGGAPETEITYSLPGVRIEHATTGRFTYCGLTACTPVDAQTTDVHHVMYWDVPGGGLTRALVRRVAGRFLGQDADAVADMRDGQAYDPETMLVQDADTQIRWYYRLKKEWQQSRKEDRPFKNPIETAVLRWRS